MCLKVERKNTRDELVKKIRQQFEELILLDKNSNERQKLFQYELVRQQGYYNMLDTRARQLTGLSVQDYNYVMENYTRLIAKNKDLDKEVKQKLDYIHSAQIAKLIALKGCKNCKDRVSKKLDVTIDDLCENCKNILT